MGKSCCKQIKSIQQKFLDWQEFFSLEN